MNKLNVSASSTLNIKGLQNKIHIIVVLEIFKTWDKEETDLSKKAITEIKCSSGNKS